VYNLSAILLVIALEYFSKAEDFTPFVSRKKDNRGHTGCMLLAKSAKKILPADGSKQKHQTNLLKPKIT
jgi:hypothetical protein